MKKNEKKNMKRRGRESALPHIFNVFLKEHIKYWKNNRIA